MGKDNYLQILREADCNNFEFPPDFDIDALERKVRKIKTLLESLELYCEVEVENSASFVYRLIVNSYKLKSLLGKKGETYSIIFSNHGQLVMIYGDKRFPKYIKKQVLDIFANEGLVFIPQNIVELPYDGQMNDPTIFDWFDRYFNCYDSDRVIKKEYYLKILRENDSKDYEWPYDFSFESMGISVQKLKTSLEKFKFKCEVDDSTQDASFTYIMTLSSKINNKYEIVGRIWFSNFANFVELDNIEQGEFLTYLPKEDKKQIIKIISDHGFIIIPDYILNLPYDGVIDELMIGNWRFRYFSYSGSHYYDIEIKT